jgi:hypothetical protein
MVYICTEWNPTSFIPISINSRNPIQFLLFNRNKNLFSFPEKISQIAAFLPGSVYFSGRQSLLLLIRTKEMSRFFALNKPPIGGGRNERRKKVVNYHKRAISAITKGRPLQSEPSTVGRIAAKKIA